MPTLGDLYFRAGFETGSVTVPVTGSETWVDEFLRETPCLAYSFQVVEDGDLNSGIAAPAPRSGTYSLRLEYRVSDGAAYDDATCTTAKTSAENQSRLIVSHALGLYLGYWVGFSTYLPDSSTLNNLQAAPYGGNIFAQLRSASNTPMSLLWGGQNEPDAAYDRVSLKTSSGMSYVNVARTRDDWVDWIMFIQPHPVSGVVRVWRDGVLVQDRQDVGFEPYTRLMLCRYLTSGNYDSSEIVTGYYDEVRMYEGVSGGLNSTGYLKVQPGQVGADPDQSGDPDYDVNVTISPIQDAAIYFDLSKWWVKINAVPFVEDSGGETRTHTTTTIDTVYLSGTDYRNVKSVTISPIGVGPFSVSPDNIVLGESDRNYSFEDWVGAGVEELPESWAKSTSLPNEMVTRGSETHGDGDYSVRIGQDGSSVGNIYTKMFRVTSGVTLRISMWIHADISSSRGLYVRLWGETTTQAERFRQWGDSYWDYNLTAAAATVAGWQELSFSVIIPSDVVEIAIGIWKWTAAQNAVWHIDDITINVNAFDVYIYDGSNERVAVPYKWSAELV